MNRFKQRLLVYLGVAIMLLLIAPVVQAMPYDIQGHWAQGAIQTLIQSGILNGYPDSTFKPDQSITRGEFAKIIAKAYDLKASGTAPFSDIQNHWAKDYISALTQKQIIAGYPDGTFQPDRPITRAEMATMLSRLIKLGTPEEKFTTAMDPSYPDVKPDFWAFRYIEIAHRLNFLPGYYQTDFQPSRLASRADTAWMVNTIRNLKTIIGKVTDAGDGSGSLMIQTDAGQSMNVTLDPATVILRNDVTTTPDKILPNDQIKLYANTSGVYSFVKVIGQVTKDDLLSRISANTKGKLSPEAVSSILSGDWPSVKGDLQGGMYNRLLSMGLNPSEAEGVLNKDWQYMDTLSKDRLTNALSGYLGITKDLSSAILDKDLPRIKSYTKIEAASAAMNRLMQKGVFGTQNNNPNF